MPFVTGVFQRLQSWVSKAASGDTISPIEFDADGNDVATALSNCILRDGTGAPIKDIPFNNHSLTGIRTAVANGEPVEYSQFVASGGTVTNKLHNASFLVNQRGVSGTITLAAAVYGHDRWKAGASGVSYSTAVSGADYQATIGSGSLQQVIAASDVDAATMVVSNAGTAQGRLYSAGNAAPVFQACPFTVTGLTVGAPAILEFSTGTVLQPQVEAAAVSHGFARRPLPLDVILCQAYYEVFVLTNIVSSYGAYPHVTFFFKTSKMAVPTITLAPTTSNVTTSVDGITIDSMLISFSTSGAVASWAGKITASCEP